MLPFWKRPVLMHIFWSIFGTELLVQEPWCLEIYPFKIGFEASMVRIVKDDRMLHTLICAMCNNIFFCWGILPLYHPTHPHPTHNPHPPTLSVPKIKTGNILLRGYKVCKDLYKFWSSSRRRHYNITNIIKTISQDKWQYINFVRCKLK